MINKSIINDSNNEEVVGDDIKVNKIPDMNFRTRMRLCWNLLYEIVFGNVNNTNNNKDIINNKYLNKIFPTLIDVLFGYSHVRWVALNTTLLKQFNSK